MGVYPQTSLQEARKKREELKHKISQGINPAEERQAKKVVDEKEALVNKYTFAYLATEYFDHILTLENPISDNHRKKQIARIANHCLPYIGDIPSTQLDRNNILEIIKRIKLNGTCIPKTPNDPHQINY